MPSSNCGLVVGSLALGVAHVGAVRQRAVAEHSAVHVVETIGNLLQQQSSGTEEMLAQISQYADQAAAVTPGAADQYVSSLKAVVDQIESQIEAKIARAQNATRTKLDTLFKALSDAKAAVEAAKKSADAADKTWFQCAADEQAKRQAAEAAEKSLSSSRSNENEACQLQQDNKGFAFNAAGKYTMKFECDFSQGDCDAKLAAFNEGTIKKSEQDAAAALAKSTANYKSLKTACDTKKQERVGAQSALGSAEEAWSSKRALCKKLAAQRQSSFCAFGSSAQDKCTAERQYSDLVAATQKSKGGDSEVDRTAEWVASQTTKCLVSQSIAKGLYASITSADADACASKVNFESGVGGKLNTRQSEFDALAKVHQCAAGAISFFNGQMWNVPAGDKPQSSAYTRTAFTPALNPTKGNFDFCGGSAPAAAAAAAAAAAPANPCDQNDASCECFAFRDANFCNTCSVDCGPCQEFCGFSPTATITKAPEGGRRDNWNNPANWDGGKVPSGKMSASVAKGLHVTVDSNATPAYSGELKLQAGSTLRLAWVSSNRGVARAVSGASRIVLEAGADLLSNLPANINFPPITLEGDASVSMPSTGVHGRSFSFKAIDGAHKFSLVSCHRCKYDFTAPSTFSQFMVNVIGTSELHAKAEGCFGPGDVSLNLGPTHGQMLKLFLDKSNAIATSAKLSLTSKSSRFGQGKIEISLAAGVSQVVAALEVDGVKAMKGMYRAGVRNIGATNVTFVGEGELVVKR